MGLTGGASSRLALGHVCRQCHRPCRRRDAGQGQEGRLGLRWKRRKATFNIVTAVSRWSAPTAKISLFETAKRAKGMGAIIKDKADTHLSERLPHRRGGSTRSDTGFVDRQRRTTAVLSNTTIVEGQVHGSIAQGLGQALTERGLRFTSGQLVSGSFMDYGMPRAHHMPVELREAMHLGPGHDQSCLASRAPARPYYGGHRRSDERGRACHPERAADHMDMPATPRSLGRLPEGDGEVE